MPTNTTVKQLKINKLTEAQYDAAVQGGVIGPNELSFLTDVDMGSIQVSVLPLAQASEEDKIYQYVGSTTASYTNGYFYKCVSDGQTPATYSWQQINVQAAGATQVNSDWDAVSGVAQILNKPSLATVAVSGSYNDLSDKPTIPSTANLVTTNTAQDITGAKSFMVPIRGKTDSSDTSTVLIAKTLSGVQVGDSTTVLSLYGTNYRPTYNSNDLAFYNDVSSKQNLITGAATSITYSNLSSSRALVSNASGKVAASTVTSTQLGYLSTATSNIQTQLNNKQARIPAGTAGEVVTYSGTAGTIGSTALATVATSGSYNDLSNTPTLGTMAAEDARDYTPTASLATVATSGLYSDLTGTPTIPTVNDATITITQGGVTKGSFTLNQSSGDTIALDAGGGSSLPSQTGHSGEFLTTDGTDASWAAITIPCILLDYVVTASTGVITIETNKAPTTKTVKEVIGGAAIAGTWTTTDTTHYVFTPTTANDILDNANGFMIKVA